MYEGFIKTTKEMNKKWFQRYVITVSWPAAAGNDGDALTQLGRMAM